MDYELQTDSDYRIKYCAFANLSSLDYFTFLLILKIPIILFIPDLLNLRNLREKTPILPAELNHLCGIKASLTTL